MELSISNSAESGERDLVILRHDIGIEWLDGQREMRHVNLVAYGDPNGYSAMAKTVGYPCAIAAKMILEGKLTGRTWSFHNLLDRIVNAFIFKDVLFRYIRVQRWFTPCTAQFCEILQYVV